jgi:hypothetical protein
VGYICPVCGFDDLIKPPYDEKGNESYEVCHCCAFEFGFDDFHDGHSFDSYKQKWISEGAEWFYQPTKPKVWNYNEQIKNIEKIKPMYVPFYLRRKEQF